MGLSAVFEGKDIIELSDGRLVIVGREDTKGSVVMLGNAGTPDATFGTGHGFMSIDLDPLASINVDTLRRVKIKTDGRIVAAGYSTDSQPLNTLGLP
jgi:hypothetical protein